MAWQRRGARRCRAQASPDERPYVQVSKEARCACGAHRAHAAQVGAGGGGADCWEAKQTLYSSQPFKLSGVPLLARQRVVECNSQETAYNLSQQCGCVRTHQHKPLPVQVVPLQDSLRG